MVFFSFQMLCSALIIIFCITATTKSNEDGVFFKVSESTQKCFLDHNNIVWSGYANSILACSHLCAKRDECGSVQFIGERKRCSLVRRVQLSCSVVNLKEDERSVYLERVGHFITWHNVEVRQFHIFMKIWLCHLRRCSNFQSNDIFIFTICHPRSNCLNRVLRYKVRTWGSYNDFA